MPTLCRAARRWWAAAGRSQTQQARLDNVAEHVLQTWLWTLRQADGTPCRAKVEGVTVITLMP